MHDSSNTKVVNVDLIMQTLHRLASVEKFISPSTPKAEIQNQIFNVENYDCNMDSPPSSSSSNYYSVFFTFQPCSRIY